MITFNYNNDETSSSPTVLVEGSSDLVRTGIVQFTNNNSKVFPPMSFEINNGRYVAVVHLSPEDPNVFVVQAFEGTLNPVTGFPQFNDRAARDSANLTLRYSQSHNKPYYMCLLIGSDSPGVYDIPSYKLQRGERPSVPAAIRKLKVMSRLFQAYTQREMRRAGYANRTFPFVEEWVSNQGIFGFDNIESPVPHAEVKVIVLRSWLPMATLRDPNRAQQNAKAGSAQFLWQHAMEVVRKTPEIWNMHQQTGTEVQCAVMYLDSTWDRKRDLITAHAALGGGVGDMRMSIFGSHGLHSYPNTFAQMTPAFLDTTMLDISEVANDCNECGTAWECLNICSGAFLHEIGHGLGCPHQVDGVMLRDYVRFNRAFMTREGGCMRTKSGGATVRQDGSWDADCHWHPLDVQRFLYHDSFTLPGDNFAKINRTTMRHDNDPSNVKPTAYRTEDGCIVRSPIGIYAVAVRIGETAKYYYTFPPQTYGGPGVQHEVKLNYNQLAQAFRQANPKEFQDDFTVTALSLGSDDWDQEHFRKWSNSRDDFVVSDFGLGRGRINAVRSDRCGRDNNNKFQFGIDVQTLYKVEVFTHHAVRGIKCYYRPASGQQPKPPPQAKSRGFMGRLEQKFMEMSTENTSGGGSSNGVGQGGRLESNRNVFDLQPGERLVGINVRCGAWVDGLQLVTDRRQSPMYGNANGGGLKQLSLPGDGYEIVGMYGAYGDWMDGIGLLYAGPGQAGR